MAEMVLHDLGQKIFRSKQRYVIICFVGLYANEKNVLQ